MSERLQAVSFWLHTNDKTTTIRGKGVLTTNGSTIEVGIPRVQITKRDLPLDLCDYSCVATTEDGEHYHGEVVESSGTPARVELVVSTGATIFTP